MFMARDWPLLTVTRIEGLASTMVRLPSAMVMSDAVLWLARQELSYTGEILTIARLRELGAVRSRTRAGKV